MTTHRRYLLLFFSLTVRIAAAQAQPTIALNTPSHPTDPGTTRTAPRKTNAGESPVYIKVYGFYGLLTPGSQVDNSSSTLTGKPTSFKTNAKGLGAGPRAGFGIGTIVSDFINIGIDADMLFGSDITTDYTYKGSNYTYTSNTRTTLQVLSVIPNITFKALARPTYYIYNRLGIVGGIVLDYTVTQTSLNTPSVGAATTSEDKTDYTKNTLSLGYQAAIGIQFRLSQSLRGYAEVVGYNQSFQPKEAQMVSTSTKTGSASTKSTSSSIYEDQGAYTSASPYHYPSYNVAMNSVGIGVGILFRF